MADRLLQSLKEAVAMRYGKTKSRKISHKFTRGPRIILNKSVKKNLK